MKSSVFARTLLGLVALASSVSAVCATQQWALAFKADYPLWSDDLYPLTELSATVTTRQSVVFADGPGKQVIAITGTRNGVAITGLWTSEQGAFFGGWAPAQGILKRKLANNGQLIPFDGIAYVTADGVQHVVYGATVNLGGNPDTNCFEMSQWASLNPSSPWVTFGGKSLTLTRVK